MTKDKRALPRPKNAVSAALDRICGDRPVTVALFLLLAGLLIVMARFLWCNVWLTLNADEASEMVLAKLLADEGSILSKNWYYSTELRVLNTNLIYALFFRLTDDWLSVRVFSTVTMIVFLLAAYFFMTWAWRIRLRYAALFSLMLVIPFSVSYHAIVLRGAYYLPHITITFFTIGLAGLFVRQKRGGAIAAAAASAVLAALAGMGGPRQILVLYLPLLAAAAVGCVLNREGEQKRHLLFAALSFGGSVIGYAVNVLLLSRIYTFKDWEIGFTAFRFSRLEQLICGIINVFGYTEGKVFSFALVKNFIAGVWVLLTLFLIVHAVKNRKTVARGYVMLALFTAAAYLIFSLLYLFTDMLYADRYWLPLTVMSFPLAAAFVSEYGQKLRLLRLSAAAFVALCCLRGMAYYYRQWGDDQTKDLRQLAAVAVDEGYTAGYASFWRANVMIELSNGRIDMYDWCDSGSEEDLWGIPDVDQTYSWLQAKSHDTERPSGKVFLLMTRTEARKNHWRSNLHDEDLLFSSKFYVAYGYPDHDTMLSVLYRGKEAPAGK